MRNAQSTHLNASANPFPIPIDREVIPQAAIAKGCQRCKECQRNYEGGWKKHAQVHDSTDITAHSYTSKSVPGCGPPSVEIRLYLVPCWVPNPRCFL